jgi:hypothetical protein
MFTINSLLLTVEQNSKNSIKIKILFCYWDKISDIYNLRRNDLFWLTVSVYHGGEGSAEQFTLG